MRIFASALALAAVAVTAVVAANAGRPARNGLIAFTVDASASGTRDDIGAFNADGSRLDWLVRESADDAEPAWSPDGSLLAFSSDRDGDTEIYVLDTRAKEVRQLTRNRGVRDTAPAWAPTAAGIAFVRKGRLFAMRADGSHQRSLTSRGHAPAWSPEGRRIAYLDGPPQGMTHISMLDLGTRRARRIPFTGISDVYSAPAWSPDGTRIAFTDVLYGGCDVYDEPPLGLLRAVTPVPCVGLVIARPNGRIVKRWYNRDQDYGDPVWSPDGREMVLAGLSAFRFAEPGSLHSLGVDGIDPSWQPVCGVAGTDRTDVLRGTATADLVCGLGGADRISGGNGRDRLFAGPGNDTVASRDRAFDVIGCGPGRDVVTADKADLVGVDCERVARR